MLGHVVRRAPVAAPSHNINYICLPRATVVSHIEEAGNVGFAGCSDSGAAGKYARSWIEA
jgi:hypothetical protein